MDSYATYYRRAIAKALSVEPDDVRSLTRVDSPSVVTNGKRVALLPFMVVAEVEGFPGKAYAAEAIVGFGTEAVVVLAADDRQGLDLLFLAIRDLEASA